MRQASFAAERDLSGIETLGQHFEEGHKLRAEMLKTARTPSLPGYVGIKINFAAFCSCDGLEHYEGMIGTSHEMKEAAP